MSFYKKTNETIEKDFAEIGITDSVDEMKNLYIKEAVDLTKHVRNVFTLARQGDDVEQATREAAIAAGRHAKRIGMSEKEMSKWLQKEYGATFVRYADLKPPYSLKEIKKFMLKGYGAKKESIGEEKIKGWEVKYAQAEFIDYEDLYEDFPFKGKKFKSLKDALKFIAGFKRVDMFDDVDLQGPNDPPWAAGRKIGTVIRGMDVEWNEAEDDLGNIVLVGTFYGSQNGKISVEIWLSPIGKIDKLSDEQKNLVNKIIKPDEKI